MLRQALVRRDVPSLHSGVYICGCRYNSTAIPNQRSASPPPSFVIRTLKPQALRANDFIDRENQPSVRHLTIEHPNLGVLGPLSISLPRRARGFLYYHPGRGETTGTERVKTGRDRGHVRFRNTSTPDPRLFDASDDLVTGTKPTEVKLWRADWTSGNSQTPVALALRRLAQAEGLLSVPEQEDLLASDVKEERILRYLDEPFIMRFDKDREYWIHHPQTNEEYLWPHVLISGRMPGPATVWQWFNKGAAEVRWEPYVLDRKTKLPSQIVLRVLRIVDRFEVRDNGPSITPGYIPRPGQYLRRVKPYSRLAIRQPYSPAIVDLSGNRGIAKALRTQLHALRRDPEAWSRWCNLGRRGDVPFREGEYEAVLKDEAARAERAARLRAERAAQRQSKNIGTSDEQSSPQDNQTNHQSQA